MRAKDHLVFRIFSSNLQISPSAFPFEVRVSSSRLQRHRPDLLTLLAYTVLACASKDGP